MIIIAVTIAIAAIIAQPFRDEIKTTQKKREIIAMADVFVPVKLVFRKGPIRELCLAAFTLIGCQACVVAFLVIYLIKEVGLELQWAGFVFGLAHGSSIFARIYLGFVAERFVKTKTILGLSGIITGVCFFSLLAAFPMEGPFGLFVYWEWFWEMQILAGLDFILEKFRGSLQKARLQKSLLVVKSTHSASVCCYPSTIYLVD